MSYEFEKQAISENLKQSNYLDNQSPISEQIRATMLSRLDSTLNYLSKGIHANYLENKQYLDLLDKMAKAEVPTVSFTKEMIEELNLIIKNLSKPTVNLSKIRKNLSNN